MIRQDYPQMGNPERLIVTSSDSGEKSRLGDLVRSIN